MAPRPPFQMGSVLGTNLSPLDELAFREWAAQNKVPFDVNSAQPQDYDMRGYYQGLMRGQPMAVQSSVNANDGLLHYPDYYKTPLHQSFSSESQFADETAPSWINDSQLAAPNGRIVFDEKSPVKSIVDILMGHRQ